MQYIHHELVISFEGNPQWILCSNQYHPYQNCALLKTLQNI